MEVSVRYVQLPKAGQKPALVFRGENLALAVVNDGVSIRTLQIDLKDYDKATRVKKQGQDYNPKVFADSINLLSTRNLAITRLASYLVGSVRENCAVHEQNLKIEPEDKIMPIRKEPGDIDEIPPELPEGSPRPRKPPKLVDRAGKAEEPKPKLKRVSLTPGPVADVILGRANGGAGAPRQGDPPRRLAPIAPLPGKAVASPKKEAKAVPKRGAGIKTLVSILAAEAGMQQQPCRVKLRAAGLRAPYDEKNEVACRKALGLPAKKGAK